MKRVILTGADGFIGRQAIRSLLERNFEVHAVSNANPPDELLFENVIWHKANLLDPENVKNLTKNVRATHLLHFAWYVEHGKFWTSEQNKTWLTASLRLAENFLENGGERLVASGTCVEYALDRDDFLNEFSTPCKPLTLYGQCKLELHEKLSKLCENSAWGRVFFLYGEFENPRRLVASVIRSLLTGEFADCSHGRQIRDFLNARDVADAFAALLDTDVRGAVNIASGEAHTIKEIVELIAELLGKSEKVRFGIVPTSENEPPRVVADVARLGDEVKWKPSMSLQEGLEKTVQWWKGQVL